MIVIKESDDAVERNAEAMMRNFEGPHYVCDMPEPPDENFEGKQKPIAHPLIVSIPDIDMYVVGDDDGVICGVAFHGGPLNRFIAFVTGDDQPHITGDWCCDEHAEIYYWVMMNSAIRNRGNWKLVGFDG